MRLLLISAQQPLVHWGENRELETIGGWGRDMLHDVLDAVIFEAYNPSHSGVVRNRLSARNEGHRLKAFPEKDCRSRLKYCRRKPLANRPARDVPLQASLMMVRYRVRFLNLCV
jgi:hypothetical protein